MVHAPTKLSYCAITLRTDRVSQLGNPQMTENPLNECFNVWPVYWEGLLLMKSIKTAVVVI